MREKLARLLDGLTGTVQFGRDDPRWDSLLGCGSRVLGLSLSDPKMLDFCDSMVLNSPKTGNFGLLLTLTVIAIDEAVANAKAIASNTTAQDSTINGANPDGQGQSANGDASSTTDTRGYKTPIPPSHNAAEGLFPRALAALRLTRLFSARMLATLDPPQVRAQVYSRGHRPPGDTDELSNNRQSGIGSGGNGSGGGGGGKLGLMPGARAQASGVATALTEGHEEESEDGLMPDSGRRGDGFDDRGSGDIVVALLSALVSLCIADEGCGTSGAYSMALGFGDVQLEGVSLLLVLLGTQAYGPPPSDQVSSSVAPDNVFLDVLLREAGSKRGGGGRAGWAIALPRAALGWFARRPAAPPGSAASVLAKALAGVRGTGRRKDAIQHRQIGHSRRRRRDSDGSGGNGGYDTVPTTTALGGRGGSGGSFQSQAQRLLFAPGALVLFMARALLYVITLRGLLAATTGDNGGDGGRNSASAGRWGDGGDGSEEVEVDEVSEALGGAPAEPGEWEGNAPVGGTGVPAGSRISPLADRGVLLMLVLLHNRRSATTAAPNAFRVAVASCVDGDLESEHRQPRPPPGANIAAAGRNASRIHETNGSAARGVGGRSHGVSSGDPASPTAGAATAVEQVGPMRISFRGLFEAFAAALEEEGTALSRRSGSIGGGGGGSMSGVGRGGGKTAASGDVQGAGREAAALLLYSLLQANPGFLRAAVVRSDADALLLPLLRTLHNCGSSGGGAKSSAKLAAKSAAAEEGGVSVGRQEQEQEQEQSPAALYVPAIVVLLFSQDSAFDRQAFRQVVQADVPWYSARNMKGASLGSLIVLCVLRCLGHNLSRLKDGYLLENCLAVLVNVAPQVEHLPPYAAQRLISVLVASSKKWIAGATAAAAREQQQVEQLPPGNGGLQIPPSQGGRGEVVGSGVAAGGGVPEEGVVDDGDAGVEGLSDIQELCGEVARVLFLFVWTCTRPRRLGANVEVLYAMLHDQTSLEAIFNHPAIASAGWAADLPRLLSHFQDLAQKEEEAGGGQGLTVEAAMAMVEKGVRHYTTEALGMGRDVGGLAAEEGRGGGEGDEEAMTVTLSYEEGENCEAFFLPYVWQLVLARTPDLNWNKSKIRIFSPILRQQQQQQQQPPQPLHQQEVPLGDDPSPRNVDIAGSSSPPFLGKSEDTRNGSGGATGMGEGRKRRGRRSSWWAGWGDRVGDGGGAEENPTAGDLSV